MFRSIDLSYCEQRPDHSRYAYNVSASYFTPAQADVELDKAIENFAALGLNAAAGIMAQGGGQYAGSHYTHSGYLNDPYNHRNDGRIQEPPYPGSYAGSMADSYYAQSIPPPPPPPPPPPMQPAQMKAIDYPRSMPSGPTSRIDSHTSGGRAPSSRHSSHHSHRKFRHGGSQYHHYQQPLPPVDEMAMIPYTHGKKSKSRYSGAGGRDDMSVVTPEDSISQVSSSRRGDERRGRTRRRDGSVASSRGTIVPGPGYFANGAGGGGDAMAGNGFYYTKEITPW